MIVNGSAPDAISVAKTAFMTNTPSCLSDDISDNESKPGNLLNLVQPELLSLAHYWLAALRDHALLSLPPGTFLYNFCIICGC